MKWQLDPQNVFEVSPVIPVMVIDKIEDALPLAQALREGGINVFEVTLRTSCALEAIKRISEAMPDCIVGAGTVMTVEQYKLAEGAGAKFVLSPGAISELLVYGLSSPVSFIPGTATPSEVMQAMNLGYRTMKFFPAESNGGVTALKAIFSAMPDVRFCPTGGINLSNAKDYLKLENVLAVGGTWMLDKHMIASKNWGHITAVAKESIKELIE